MKPADFSKPLPASVNSVGAGVRDTPLAKQKGALDGGPSFESTLQALDAKKPAGRLPTEFDLRQQMPAGLQGGMTGLRPEGTTGLRPEGGVKFSNHAVDRMMSRGINFSPDDIKRLNEVVDKAAAKGSRDSLVLMGDSALIVSVKNKTVVTVMDKASMKENVFTNIDSTIVM